MEIGPSGLMILPDGEEAGLSVPRCLLSPAGRKVGIGDCSGWIAANGALNGCTATQTWVAETVLPSRCNPVVPGGIRRDHA